MSNHVGNKKWNSGYLLFKKNILQNQKQTNKKQQLISKSTATDNWGTLSRMPFLYFFEKPHLTHF